jgi:hypothetical protein
MVSLTEPAVASTAGGRIKGEHRVAACYPRNPAGQPARCRAPRPHGCSARAVGALPPRAHGRRLQQAQPRARRPTGLHAAAEHLAAHAPMVGMVVTTSPSFSLYRICRPGAGAGAVRIARRVSGANRARPRCWQQGRTAGRGCHERLHAGANTRLQRTHRRLAGGVEAHHQNAHLLLGEQAVPQLRECQTHGCFETCLQGRKGRDTDADARLSAPERGSRGECGAGPGAPAAAKLKLSVHTERH